MKKLFALLLAAVMLAAALSGCIVIEPATTDPSDTEKPGSNFPSFFGPVTDPDPTDPPQAVVKPTLEETLVYDDNGVKVYATGLGDSLFGKEVKLRAENSTDQNITLSCSTFIVNGVTVSGSMHISVAAGKKANDYILFYNTEMDWAGIEHIATVSLHDAKILNSDNYDTLAKLNMDIRTSIADTYTQEMDEVGVLLLQQDGITVIGKDVKETGLGQGLILLVKNDTDQDLIFDVENTSFNGFTVNTFNRSTICKHSYGFATVEIYSSQMEENDIETIEEVTFCLQIMEAGSYDTLLKTDELGVAFTE